MSNKDKKKTEEYKRLRDEKQKKLDNKELIKK